MGLPRLFLTTLICSLQLTHGQQTYGGDPTAACSGAATNSSSPSVDGYPCNGLFPACEAFLLFRSSPPYDSVSSISQLLNSDPSSVSATNSVPNTTVLDVNRLLMVPINCTCSSNQYYQANVGFTAQNQDSISSIASKIFQGLSTCQALLNQNPGAIDGEGNVQAGTEITVPLRCSCPTEIQTEADLKYLITYVVAEGDTVMDVASRFRVDPKLILEANSLSKQSVIDPFTTLLLPIKENQRLISLPSSSAKSKFRWKHWVIIGVVSLLSIMASAGFALAIKVTCCNNCCNSTVQVGVDQPRYYPHKYVNRSEFNRAAASQLPREKREAVRSSSKKRVPQQSGSSRVYKASVGYAV